MWRVRTRQIAACARSKWSVPTEYGSRSTRNPTDPSEVDLDRSRSTSGRRPARLPALTWDDLCAARRARDGRCRRETRPYPRARSPTRTDPCVRSRARVQADRRDVRAAHWTRSSGTVRRFSGIDLEVEMMRAPEGVPCRRHRRDQARAVRGEDPQSGRRTTTRGSSGRMTPAQQPNTQPVPYGGASICRGSVFAACDLRRQTAVHDAGRGRGRARGHVVPTFDAQHACSREPQLQWLAGDGAYTRAAPAGPRIIRQSPPLHSEWPSDRDRSRGYGEVTIEVPIWCPADERPARPTSRARPGAQRALAVLTSKP